MWLVKCARQHARGPRGAPGGAPPGATEYPLSSEARIRQSSEEGTYKTVKSGLGVKVQVINLFQVAAFALECGTGLSGGKPARFSTRKRCGESSAHETMLAALEALQGEHRQVRERERERARVEYPLSSEAHIRQSRPDSGHVFPAKVLKTC